MAFKLFKIFNLAYFLLSSFFWIALRLPVNLMSVVWAFLITVTAFAAFKKIRIPNQFIVLLGILIILSVWSLLTVGLSFGILTFFSYFPALILFVIPKENQRETLLFVTKWFGIIMGISLIIFFITRFITIAPPLGMFEIPDSKYDPFKNYILFIESQSIENLFIYRFNGPFLEPGHLSLVASLLIFANRFDFKSNKYLWVCLACILISLSLAGYVILTIGYFVIQVKKLKTLILFGVFLGSIFLYVNVIWEGGNNPVNELIFARLEYDEEKGVAGNNRTTEQTDKYFEANFKAGRLWTGLGTQQDDAFIAGAGYKIYFLRYGIISFLIVLLFYYNLIPPNVNKRYVLAFLLMIVVIFLQRAYPGWYSWLLTFTLGCGISRKGIRRKKTRHLVNNFSSQLKEFNTGISHHSIQGFQKYNKLYTNETDFSR